MQFSHEAVAKVWYAAVRQLLAERGYPHPPVWGLLCEHQRAWWVEGVVQARRGLSHREIHEALRYQMEQSGRCPATIGRAGEPHLPTIAWEDLDGTGRLRFALLQMNTAALTLDVPPDLDRFAPVSAPLRGMRV
jgi:hypothetical protein